MKTFLVTIFFLISFYSFSQEYDDMYFNKNDRKELEAKRKNSWKEWKEERLKYFENDYPENENENENVSSNTILLNPDYTNPSFGTNNNYTNIDQLNNNFQGYNYNRWNSQIGLGYNTMGGWALGFNSFYGNPYYYDPFIYNNYLPYWNNYYLQNPFYWNRLYLYDPWFRGYYFNPFYPQFYYVERNGIVNNVVERRNVIRGARYSRGGQINGNTRNYENRSRSATSQSINQRNENVSFFGRRVKNPNNNYVPRQNNTDYSNNSNRNYINTKNNNIKTNQHSSGSNFRTGTRSNSQGSRPIQSRPSNRGSNNHNRDQN